MDLTRRGFRPEPHQVYIFGLAYSSIIHLQKDFLIRTYCESINVRKEIKVISFEKAYKQEMEYKLFIYKKVIYNEVVLTAAQNVKKVQYWIFNIVESLKANLYLEQDLSVYKMLYILCSLPSNNVTSAIY